MMFLESKSYFLTIKTYSLFGKELCLEDVSESYQFCCCCFLIWFALLHGIIYAAHHTKKTAFTKLEVLKDQVFTQIGLELASFFCFCELASTQNFKYFCKISPDLSVHSKVLFCHNFKKSIQSDQIKCFFCATHKVSIIFASVLIIFASSWIIFIFLLPDFCAIHYYFYT